MARHGLVSPAFCGHVSECAVVIVVVERARRRFALEGHGDRRRIREVDIGPAVAVVVEEDHAAAHRLQDVLLLIGRGMGEGDPGFRGNILELGNGAIGALCRFGAGGEAEAWDGPFPGQESGRWRQTE